MIRIECLNIISFYRILSHSSITHVSIFAWKHNNKRVHSLTSMYLLLFPPLVIKGGRKAGRQKGKKHATNSSRLSKWRTNITCIIFLKNAGGSRDLGYMNLPPGGGGRRLREEKKEQDKISIMIVDLIRPFSKKKKTFCQSSLLSVLMLSLRSFI